MIKISYNSNGLRNLSVENAIKCVAQNGYNGIELSFYKKHLHPLTATDKELSQIKHIIQDNGIKLPCIAMGGADLLSDIPYEPSLISNDKSGRNRRIQILKRGIEIAQYLECPVVNFASGFKEEISSEDAKKYLIEGIYKVLEGCGEIILAIEPEPEMFIGTTDSAISVIEEVNSPNFKLNLDIGHVYCSEESYLKKIENALDYTVHCHIEDIKNHIHHHEIPGTGDIDFSSVVKILKEKKYDGFISVELYHHVDVCEFALSESIKYLKSQL